MTSPGTCPIVFTNRLIVFSDDFLVTVFVVDFLLDDYRQRQSWLTLGILIGIAQAKTEYRVDPFRELQQFRYWPGIVANPADITNSDSLGLSSSHQALRHQCHIHRSDYKVLGKKIGKYMKQAAGIIAAFGKEQIAQLDNNQDILIENNRILDVLSV